MPARLALVLLVAFSAALQPVAAQSRQLTIDDIYDPVKRIDFNGSIPRITWLPDGRSYLVASAKGLAKVDASNGREEPFLDTARFERALAGLAAMPAGAAKSIAAGADFTYNAAYSAVLVDHGEDLYVYDVAAARAARLTSAPGEETNASFSPDGRLVAFVRASNLYVVDVATGRERQLTTDGGPERLNGRLDWVYEEEIYGRGETTAYWWSPDSSMLAYLSLDERDVPVFVIPDDVPTDQNVEMTRYPQVGDPNPGVRVGAVAASGGATTWMDLSPYEPADRLVVRVGWTPDARRVVYQVQNRVQSWLDLNTGDPKTGARSLVLREQSPYWVDAIGLPVWLPDGAFLWQSDRSGFRHVYRYRADGALVGAVTTGDWDVRNLYGAGDGWVYFQGAEHSPVANHVYRIKLDGTGLARLTDVEGDHSANFNDRYTMFVDTSSTAMTPHKARLRDATGRSLRVVAENPVPALAEFKLGAVEFVKVPARDGIVMEAMMIKPPDFDPSKKYPVMSFTYAGPGAQSARDAWGRQSYMWHQMLAQRGYIIWILDNRAASAKGVQSAHGSFQNFGEPELRDLVDGVAWLGKQPYVDASRVGVWGWSFGGFMAGYALTHSDVFKIGIVGAPVTDWRLYDSVYTERYMGLPSTNAAGYDRGSVLKAAANLKGRMLLIHGAIDDNVHLQNSTAFVDALQKAGKQFEFMIYPQSRHGVTHPLRVKHMRDMMARFILENL